MGFISKLFGFSESEEETPVLKESEHYPVDEAGPNDEIVDDFYSNIRTCSKCAAVYYGCHSC